MKMHTKIKSSQEASKRGRFCNYFLKNSNYFVFVYKTLPMYYGGQTWSAHHVVSQVCKGIALYM